MNTHKGLTLTTISKTKCLNSETDSVPFPITLMPFPDPKGSSVFNARMQPMILLYSQDPKDSGLRSDFNIRSNFENDADEAH